MDQEILWVVSHMPKTDDKNLPTMGLEEIAKVRTSYENFSQYTRTPFTKLDHMVAHLGVKEIYLKDEFYRFDLNVFRVPGGSFSMVRYIAKGTGRDVPELPCLVPTSDQLREEFGQATFFATTDGNYGRDVVWAANRPGQRAVVHALKGSTQTRLENIAKEGAQVDTQETNYDNRVRLAAKEADETPRSVMIRDTAWDGHEEIPSWTMQGYGTMAVEVGGQLKEYGYERSAHIFVQAGVGSLTGAVVGYFSNLYVDNPSAFVAVETETTARPYKGAAAGDGQIRIMDGDMETIVAGLARGESNTISWDVLKNHVKVFIAAPNWVVADGVCMLGAPIKDDASATSGESGIAPFGALTAIMSMDEYADLRKDIGPDKNPRVLLPSTEDDTDSDRHKNIAWKGPDK